jgi:nitroreductase
MNDTTQPESPRRRDPHLLRSILERRSVRVLTAPGPTPDEVVLLLRAAATVPDHGLLRPFRFVVVQDRARDRFGEALATAALQQRPDLPPAIVEKARRKAFAAPLFIVLIASPRPGARIPEWEQHATAACTGYAIVLAAHALGLGAIWKSTPFVEAAALRGLFEMTTAERLLGWINVGTAAEPHAEQPHRPAGREPIVSVLGAAGHEPGELLARLL